MRDEGKRGIVVAGLSEHNVESIAQVASLLHVGALHRATASTLMNAQSSRSHAICTLTMEQYNTVSEGVEARFSKFHLVDLAGSERAKRTNAVGARFKEGININRGLLSLGNVINALCERSRSSSAATTHVPYRDSKLTRLLQDSLGGNSKTLMIACISPADINFEETSNTLRYASRARNIQNTAVVNKEMSAANEVAYLKQQLELLQLQLMQQSKSQQPRGGRVAAATSSNQVLNADVADLEAELQRWKDVARTREEELRMVMSAKNKWKRVADEFMAKKKSLASTVASGFGVPVRSAGSTASSTVSPTKALALEAMEFEKTIQIQIPDVVTINESCSSPPDHEQTQADLDNLSDVIVEKEKIMQELAALPSLSGTEARLASLTTSYEQKITKLENRVGRLAAEKKRLSLEIKASGQNADAVDQKDKEDVRVQLQKIQNQLQVAKQAEEECKRLTALWKTGKFKISTLEQDIVDMKKQKAGLQRKLRAEAETHRREKREQDLKILQLKRQDQRKQHELQKLSALHSKQNSVLKRKTEEVAMANKRMRTMAQNQQQMKKTQGNKPAMTARSSSAVDAKQEAGGESSSSKPTRSDYMENVAMVLEKTFEIRMTIQGAKNAIQMDLEERKRIALEISRLESSPSAAKGDALASLKDALKEKNAEIRLLQQKLASVERNNAMPDELFPASATACHQIIRHLVDTTAESKSSCLELENSMADIDAVEDQLVTQTDKYEYVIAGLKREMQELGRHAAIPLDTFEFYSSRDAVMPEGKSKPSLLQQELNETKRELEALKLQMAMQGSISKKKPVSRKRVEEIIDIDEIVSSSEHDEDDDEDSEDDDSDYVEDEGKRRATKSRTRASTTPSAAGKVQRTSGVAAGGIDPMNEIDELLAKPSRAGMPLCCSCNGKCATKACACKAEKQKCGSDCACNASRCHNREGFNGVKKSRKSELNDKENEVESFFYVAAVGVDKENEDPAPQSKLKKLWSQHDSKMEQFGSARKAKLTGSLQTTPPSLLKKPSKRFLLKPASTNVLTCSSSNNNNTSGTIASRISRFL